MEEKVKKVKKAFDPAKYGMIIYPGCYGQGFIENCEAVMSAQDAGLRIY